MKSHTCLKSDRVYRT